MVEQKWPKWPKLPFSSTSKWPISSIWASSKASKMTHFWHFKWLKQPKWTIWNHSNLVHPYPSKSETAGFAICIWFCTTHLISITSLRLSNIAAGKYSTYTWLVFGFCVSPLKILKIVVKLKTDHSSVKRMDARLIIVFFSEQFWRWWWW